MERFVIYTNKGNGGVSILDTEEDNLLLFTMDVESIEDIKYLQHELDAIVTLLNFQDNEIKRTGGIISHL